LRSVASRWLRLTELDVQLERLVATAVVLLVAAGDNPGQQCAMCRGE